MTIRSPIFVLQCCEVRRLVHIEQLVEHFWGVRMTLASGDESGLFQ